MDLVSPGSRITTEFFCCFPACGSSLNLRAITSLSVKTWLAIVAVSLKTPRLTEILDYKIHTIRTHKKRVTLGNCGRKTDRETDKRSRTHIHTHFLTAREKKKVTSSSVKLCRGVRDLDLITGGSLESRHLTSMTML